MQIKLKRITSLVCAVLIFVTCMAVPARAFESDTDWINLLDYGGVNNTTSNTIVFTGSTEALYKLPDLMLLGYIDFIFYSNREITSVSCADTELTFVKIDDKHYRAYGLLPSLEYRNLDFDFISSNTSNVTTLTFLSVRMSTHRTVSSEIGATIDISSLNLNTTLTKVAGEIAFYSGAYQGDYNSSGFSIVVNPDGWQKYDYINVMFLLTNVEVSSVTANYGSDYLPADVQFIDNASGVSGYYFVNVRVDLSEIDRTSGYKPVITIGGAFWVETSFTIQCYGCSGMLASSGVDPDIFWLRSIYNGLLNGFASVGDWISSLSSDLNAWIQTQTLDLQNSIVVWFSNLKGWIETQTAAVQNSIVVWFSNLKGWIDSQTDRLESAIRGDTSSGDQFQDEVQEELDELDKAQDTLDSVDRPSMDDIETPDFDIIGTDGITLTGQVFETVMNSGGLGTMFIVAILVSIVAYVLYGKR